jgi:hypothetical protein
MSKFGNSSPQMTGQNRFQIQRQHSWSHIRNNVDLLIQSSSLQQKEVIEEINPYMVVESKCNNLEMIYECAEDCKIDKLPPPPAPVTEPIIIVTQEAETSSSVPRKKMDFASLVFKYRNELARRKNKELQEQLLEK